MLKICNLFSRKKENPENFKNSYLFRYQNYVGWIVSAIFWLYKSPWEEPLQSNLILISEFHCFSVELFNYKNEEMADDFFYPHIFESTDDLTFF